MKKIITMGSLATMSLFTTAMANTKYTATEVTMPSEVNTLVSRILGGAQIVGVIVAIGMLIYAGFKYLTAGAGDKAKAKDMFVPIVVGAALVALAPAIGSWLFTTLSGN